MTLLERVVEKLEAEASQEEMEAGRYAKNRVEAMTNYELLELVSAALEEEST